MTIESDSSTSTSTDAPPKVAAAESTDGEAKTAEINEPDVIDGAPDPNRAVTLGQILGCFYLLTVVFMPLMYIAYQNISVSRCTPLDESAPPEKFSEARAMRHVLKLAEEIGFRQEGSPGLAEAAVYIRDEVEALRVRAGGHLRVEVDESLVSGSFLLRFLGHSMTMAYQNLTNIAVRLSNAAADPSAPAVLLNAHFDSALHSAGASDCAGCVACLLELMRQIVDSRYLPPAPVVLLFNGGEEIFMKAAHGFVKSHPWSATVGAVINLESAGASLPDSLVQSGPGSWPSRVYANSAVVSAATGLSQDIFPLIAGDTDFRIFAIDTDDVPGIDLIQLLNGYVYHTPNDTPENMMPGALQTRGDNLLPLLEGLATASELKTRAERTRDKQAAGASARKEPTPVYFDLWGYYVVHYSHPVALALSFALFGAVMLLPRLATAEASGSGTVQQRYDDFATGIFFYVLSCVLALVLPIFLAVIRVGASRLSISWYSKPYLPLLMFAPISMAGVLIPQLLRRGGGYSTSQSLPPEKLKMVEWSSHWGGIVATNAFLALLITWAGGGSSFIPFWWAVFMLPGFWIARALQPLFGANSPLTLLGYFALGVPPAAYCVQLSLVLHSFVVERMGQMGTAPLPVGPYLSDMIVSGLIGLLTVLCAAPILVAAARWLARPHVIRALVYASIVFATVACRYFPYSVATPKRSIFQRLYFTEGNPLSFGMPLLPLLGGHSKTKHLPTLVLH
eukprot:TRINITY_DN5439_c0_g2_i2.p1 TRINITY_DN5439_c0_g2~~TRINITY_DN5439_c0_g2_i2.p1  ORF type:complete len:736 (-),score=120.13 TRINITY_DN5439_c0_g2_i2:591-2798(-)